MKKPEKKLNKSSKATSKTPAKNSKKSVGGLTKSKRKKFSSGGKYSEEEWEIIISPKTDMMTQY